MIEKRVSNRNQNNMGEITKSTRAYALPTQAQPIALSTEFTYDSWGVCCKSFIPMVKY